MEFRRASGILGAAFISIGLAACGGGPDIEKAKADFANPTGKTSDKNGVIAAQGKQDASGSAMSASAGGLPGFGLTAVGKGNLAKASVTRLLVPQAERMRAIVQGTQMRNFALNIAQSEGCGDDVAGEALGADFAEDAADGSASGSFSFSIDYSACAGSGLTGSADYNVEFEIDQTKMYMLAEISMNAVCAGDECVTGSMAMELDGTFGGADGLGGGFQTLVAWDLTSTHEGKEIKSKGGIKMGFDDQASTIEILVYVNTADGEEWSYVLKATQNFDGAGSLEIRGSDGNLSCTWMADGSGQCSGDAGALEWTAEESEAIEDEEWFAEG